MGHARIRYIALTTSIALTAGAFAFFAAVALGVGASASNADDGSSSFRKNADGQTYGSSAGLTPNESPDLVLVVGDSGEEGYVRSKDLDDPEVGSPAEALASMKTERSAKGATIQVYDANGKKKDDTFTISPALDPQLGSDN